MDPKDVSLIDAARRKFDAISENARFDIYQKVLSHYQRHPNSPWSGAPLRDLEETIRQFYADLGVTYDKVFRDTLPPLMQKFYDRAVEEMRTAGVRNAILGTPDSGRIKYFLNSAFDQVAMKTQNMSFQHIKALRSLTADVTRQMSITGATRREVSKALLERAMDVPGFQFIDKAGTNWPLKSYFNTLARTELMNAARASYDDKVTDEGFDVMKLTTSGHCCEKCARFEGRLFSLTGATKGLPSKDDLIEAGVFHPNCTHSYSLVPDYIRERDYTLGGKKNSSGEQREEARYKGQLLVGAGNKSTEVFIASKDMSGDDLQQHQTAVNAIGKVHSLGAMPEIPVLRKKAHPEFPNAAGQCVTDANGNPVEILIFDASTHKAFTEIHEMGHALDDFMKFTKSRLSDGVFDAIDCSRGKIELEELFDKFFGEKREMLEYLLRSDEIFARAYSQYIASRSGDATLLSQLNSSRRGVIFYGGLWEDDDFAPIAEEFDKMLKKVGMIR